MTQFIPKHVQLIVETLRETIEASRAGQTAKGKSCWQYKHVRATV